MSTDAQQITITTKHGNPPTPNDKSLLKYRHNGASPAKNSEKMVPKSTKPPCPANFALLIALCSKFHDTNTHNAKMSPTAQESSALYTPTTPMQLIKAQWKALKKLEENERNRKRIKLLANIEQMNKQSCCSASHERALGDEAAAAQ